MSSFVVKSSSGDYAVHIDLGGFQRVVEEPFAAAVADRRFVDTLAWPGLPVIGIEASEDRKTLAACEEIVCALREHGIGRGDRVLAVGGGLVQDLVTLSASLYMRGIPWTYAPTTLMAMADSCVGGKSSINVGAFKNLVGNIYPPDAIYIDPLFVDDLDAVQVACGLCEAAKIAFCGGSADFARYLELYRTDWRQTDRASLIEHVLLVKRRFVEADEHDRGERRLLNFGHTFGHALESATGFEVPHGVAVGLGMLAAVELARDLGLGEDAGDLAAHCLELVGGLTALAPALGRFDPGAFERAVSADKKHGRAELRVVVPATGGGVVEVGIPRTKESLDQLGAAMASTLRLVG